LLINTVHSLFHSTFNASAYNCNDFRTAVCTFDKIVFSTLSVAASSILDLIVNAKSLTSAKVWQASICTSYESKYASSTLNVLAYNFNNSLVYFFVFSKIKVGIVSLARVSISSLTSNTLPIKSNVLAFSITVFHFAFHSTFNKLAYCCNAVITLSFTVSKFEVISLIL